MTLLWLVRPVNAIAIKLPGPDPREIPMPDKIRPPL